MPRAALVRCRRENRLDAGVMARRVNCSCLAVSPSLTVKPRLRDMTRLSDFSIASDDTLMREGQETGERPQLSRP